MKKLHKYIEENQVTKFILIFMVIYFFLYLLGVCIGFIFGQEISSIDIGQDKDLIGIFLNNLILGISIVILGSFTGGFYSVAIILINGGILGKLLRYLFAQDMLHVVPLGLFPHAILEIISLCVFSAISVIPISCLFYYFKSSNIISRKLVFQSLLIMVFSIISLFLAAILECYVSKIII